MIDIAIEDGVEHLHPAPSLRSLNSMSGYLGNDQNFVINVSFLIIREILAVKKKGQ